MKDRFGNEKGLKLQVKYSYRQQYDSNYDKYITVRENTLCKLKKFYLSFLLVPLFLLLNLPEIFPDLFYLNG